MRPAPGRFGASAPKCRSRASDSIDTRNRELALGGEAPTGILAMCDMDRGNRGRPAAWPQPWKYQARVLDAEAGADDPDLAGRAWV